MEFCKVSSFDMHWCSTHAAVLPEGATFCGHSGNLIEKSDTVTRAYRIEMAVGTLDDLVAAVNAIFGPLHEVGGGYAIAAIRQGAPGEVHVAAYVPEPFKDNLPQI